MTTQQGMVLLLVLAIFVIYVILGVLYESFIHPITILTGPAVRRVRRAGDADGLRARISTSMASSASSC